MVGGLLFRRCSLHSARAVSPVEEFGEAKVEKTSFLVIMARDDGISGVLIALAVHIRIRSQPILALSFLVCNCPPFFLVPIFLSSVLGARGLLHAVCTQCKVFLLLEILGPNFEPFFNVVQSYWSKLGCMFLRDRRGSMTHGSMSLPMFGGTSVQAVNRMFVMRMIQVCTACSSPRLEIKTCADWSWRFPCGAIFKKPTVVSLF